MERMRWTNRLIVGCGVAVLSALFAAAMLRSVPAAAAGQCQSLPSTKALRDALVAAPSTGGPAGGIFEGTRMWAAVVNRDGELCSYVTSTADPSQVWPGSQAIAKSKAYATNAFSLDTFALST